MRNARLAGVGRHGPFLSIQAQDFIEDRVVIHAEEGDFAFLSIQAQDFIEDEPLHVTNVLAQDS